MSDNINTKNKSVNSIKIGISQGDTNGIGLEVLLKTFVVPEMLDLCIPIIYGHLKVANYHKKKLGLEVPFHVINSAEEAEANQLNFVNLVDEEVNVEFGTESPVAGHAAYESLERATTDLKMGLTDAIVTAPINKASIQSSNFRFVGHTEYLENRLAMSGEQSLMVLCNDIMKVALVTTHVPISELSAAITQTNIEEKARILHHSLCRDFNITNPRIAILALNPHAGDNGVLGTEEQQVIIPSIQVLSSEGLPVYGPFSADAFFGQAQYRHFDGVLAMFHDQGLAPMKALTIDGGFNFTAGLPFVRTSPDHGTAFDIAGKNIADANSFRKAVYAAIDICHNRRAYDKAHENPLPKIYQERKER